MICQDWSPRPRVSPAPSPELGRRGVMTASRARDVLEAVAARALVGEGDAVLRVGAELEADLVLVVLDDLFRTCFAWYSFDRGWSPELVLKLLGGVWVIEPELSSTTMTFGRTFSSRTSSGSWP